MKAIKYFIVIIFMELSVTGANAQDVSKIDYEIEGMTIAVTNMTQMLDFYTHTFGIQFEERELSGFKLYSGVWGEMKLLFCPAELAGNKATQNRHQFDVIVSNLEEIESITTAYGGLPMGDKTEREGVWTLGIYDPDKNSILFKVLKD